MTEKVASIQPALRFPEFSGDWIKADIDWFLEKSSKPVSVKPEQPYQEIGVRSHGKGIFHKDADVGASLGDKRVFWVVPDALVLNIVFAWEQAVALTTSKEDGFIASHRFPMFVPRKGRADTRFARDFFLRPRGKWLLELASPGGAGRNKTLGQSNFAELSVVWPSQPEQKKIADFLGAVDKRIRLLQRRRDALAEYKTGMMQRLFDQSIRFTRDDGTAFPDWVEKRLADIASVVGGGTPDTNVEKYWGGNIPWFTPTEIKSKYLGSSARMLTPDGLKNSSAKLLPVGALLLSTRASVGDVGIALRECATNQGFQSLVMKGKNVNEFWYQWILQHKRKFVRWAAGSTFLEINKAEVSKIKAETPHPDEQRKIADFLGALDDKIAAVSAQVDHMQTFKKGLLQTMFV